MPSSSLGPASLLGPQGPPLFGCHVRVDSSDQGKVVSHMLKHPYERLTLLGLQPLAQPRFMVAGYSASPIQEGAAGGSEVEGPGSSVCWNRAADDQTSILQMVYNRHHAACGYLQHVGQGVLGHARRSLDIAHEGELPGLEVQGCQQLPESPGVGKSQLRKQETN